MKRALLMLFLIGTVVLLGCTPKYGEPIGDMLVCSSHAECGTVVPYRCCACPVAINTQYIRQIDQGPAECDQICDECPESITECVDGQCVIREYRRG